MKLLDRLVLKDLVPMLGLGIAMFFTLWFAADPLRQAEGYLSLGVPLPLVIRLVGWNIPPVLALTFPMGMLLAVLLGFGRISADSEAVALFAGGIPFARIVAPALVLGLAASVIGYAINDRVASYANLQKANITKDIKAGLGQKGETDQPLDFPVRSGDRMAYLVHADQGIDFADRAMRDVTIVHYDGLGRPAETFYAEKAIYQAGNNWTLVNGQVYTGWPSPVLARVDKTRVLDLGKNLESASFLDRDPDTLTFHDLRRQIALLRQEPGAGHDPALLNAEMGLWGKVALPFSALIFTLVGAPLGLRPQRVAKYTGWLLAISIIFGYYVLYTTLSSVARGGHCNPMLAAFLPNLIGLAAGSGLIWKASH
ncbi:MAG: LptF/LptG family permease [Armatimonadota bacterium]|nr:LptF/LptG family permease [Armatimonadota bacterium]